MDLSRDREPEQTDAWCPKPNTKVMVASMNPTTRISIGNPQSEIGNRWSRHHPTAQEFIELIGRERTGVSQPLDLLSNLTKLGVSKVQA